MGAVQNVNPKAQMTVTHNLRYKKQSDMRSTNDTPLEYQSLSSNDSAKLECKIAVIGVKSAVGKTAFISSIINQSPSVINMNQTIGTCVSHMSFGNRKYQFWELESNEVSWNELEYRINESFQIMILIFDEYEEELLKKRVHKLQTICTDLHCQMMIYCVGNDRLNMKLTGKEKEIEKLLQTIYDGTRVKVIVVDFTFSIANIIEAIRQVRVNSKAKFDETIDLQLRLNVDPKHGDQMVRGNVLMPGGLGKKFILAVFAPESQTDQILEAGADIVGQALLLQQLKEGTYKFDKLIATNEMMNLLKPFARQLGPQGLMPNLKAGTLVTTEQLLTSIKATKAGSIEFRVDQGKNLMVPLGKVSFEEQRIFQNIEAFSTALMDKRPASIKGSLIKSALVKTTMGVPVQVDPATLDVKSKDYALRGLV